MNERTAEQISTVVKNAKLSIDELLPVSQPLYFSESFDNDTVKLLELDPSVIGYAQEGQSLIIRGDETDTAVVCTESKTFELREAETSNSLLLLPHCSLPDDMQKQGFERVITAREVVGMLHTYYEMRPCKPKIEKLKQLLSSNLYKGKEYETENDDSSDISAKLYTFADLLDKVQASEAELHKALNDLSACEIDGYWRMLDFDYLSVLLNRILSFIEENSWNYTCVPLTPTLDTLEELEPRLLLQHCLDVFGTQEASMENLDDVTYRLDEDKICRFFAEELLRPTLNFSLIEFLKSWQQTVPEGMTTSLDQIRGLGLVDRSIKPEVVKYYPASELPADLHERFSALFKTKPKWTLAEITPYIEDLTTEKTDVNALLTKHARSSIQNGIRVYSSKSRKS